MDYLQLMYLLGCCSCFYWTKGEHVQFNTTQPIYNIGDTASLTCYVRSGWLTVSIGRNNSDLGYCSTIMNRCYPTADIRDEYGNYELKLEKSRPMLVIKNVTIDEDGADFTCHWTSYTDTISFVVTDIAVTTPSMHEENTSDSNMMLVVVVVPVSVIMLVMVLLVIVGIVIVRQPVFYRRIGVKALIDWRGRRGHEHVQAPINTDIERTQAPGQGLQTITHTFNEVIGENMSSLSPNCDVNYDHQKQLNRHMEDRHGPNVYDTECVISFLERRTDDQGRQ